MIEVSKIKVKINDQEHDLSLEDAHKLFEELKIFFKEDDRKIKVTLKDLEEAKERLKKENDLGKFAAPYFPPLEAKPYAPSWKLGEVICVNVTTLTT